MKMEKQVKSIPDHLKVNKIKKITLKSILGGPTRRAELDHVGAYG